MALPSPLRPGTPPLPDEAAGLLAWALQLLSTRILLWVVTLGAGVLWILAILRPELGRLLAAVGYTLTVLWPYIYLERHGRV